MTTLNGSTLRRLKQLKQTTAVWEGDRRSLPRFREYQSDSNLIHLGDRIEEEDHPQCILWVDGSMGMVRAMDVVDGSVGQEAFVRALLQAIERPQSPAQPGLPQKILVCDRQLQFYLRGVLQELDITVEHVENLPLVDEIFANIIQHANITPPSVPASQAADLYRQSDRLWRNAPWNYLWDHEVIEIELNRWDLGSLYAIVMGRLGLEQGVIFYRSKESLVRFRQRLALEEAEDDLEETFLHQDCLFNLFESSESLSESEMRVIRSHGWPTTQDNVHPIFGTLHPLEGGRPFLYEEEAIALTVATNALNQFLAQHSGKLKAGKFVSLKGTYSIPTSPNQEGKSETVKVLVKTLPDLAEELHSFAPEQEDDEDDEPLIHEDLWPDKAVFQLSEIPWSLVTELRQTAPYRYLADTSFPQKGTAFSGLLIQTSRPKALELIKQIESFGGIKGICFNPAESFFGESCDLGLIVMGNDDLHLFGEFHKDIRELEQVRKNWNQRCKTAKGKCGVLIAMGVTGASRGNPEPRHILGYYEVELIPAKDLGLGTLRSEPMFDFEF
ncbi:hypothetical protein V2H45_02660 [Tumidithrix elongata RA019]|uniref:Uncharacterized protein n=1 Tax=Tumidithrix elongata BACA0141 TaxID=2716417 RepID=A0AAW9PQ65_9CYAN|nr:hypothetical protein [Tumidithrix elongata RA019]